MIKIPLGERHFSLNFVFENSGNFLGNGQVTGGGLPDGILEL